MPLILSKKKKKDSAIIYDYDEDFNKIEKVTSHTRKEPSFSLEIASKSPEKIYSFLKSQNSINNDSVFVNFPFAKTKANFSENYFSLKANIFEKKQTNPTAKCIFYLSENLAKIEENYNNITQTNSAISALFNNFMYIRFLSYRCNVSNDEPFEEFVSEISSI
jgi:hypothetical protein